MQRPDTISIVKDLIDAVNNHEMDAVLRLFDDNAILSAEPPLPRSPKRIYSGRGEIGQWLGALMAEHVSIVGSNFKASGNEVNWDARISSDRFAELGIDPLESRVRTVLEGSLIRSIGLNFSPDSVKKIESVTAAQPG